MLNILTLAEYSFPTTREQLQNIMAIPQAVSKMKVVTVTSPNGFGLSCHIWKKGWSPNLPS